MLSLAAGLCTKKLSTSKPHPRSSEFRIPELWAAHRNPRRCTYLPDLLDTSLLLSSRLLASDLSRILPELLLLPPPALVYSSALHHDNQQCRSVLLHRSSAVVGSCLLRRLLLPASAAFFCLPATATSFWSAMRPDLPTARPKTAPYFSSTARPLLHLPSFPNLACACRSRCRICLRSVKTGQGTAIFTAECGHNFHFPCITAHMKKQGSDLSRAPFATPRGRRCIF
ncbi:hypothetical protein OROMI_023632 [Orobanche minor]